MPRRPMLAVFAAALAACSSLPPAAAQAVGRLVDVRIVDRETGETLTPIRHDGAWWIAGRPGARYGVTLLSRTGQRTLSVVSVDGVNAISGDTAAWSQTGYVLDPWQQSRIDGWRKNTNQVAAFEFTALPDSYAARTGRPANVGVIGVATFSEKLRVMPIARAPAASASAAPDESRRQAAPGDAIPPPAPAATPAEPSNSEFDATRFKLSDRNMAKPSQPSGRIGTGHGQLEESQIEYVAFQRAQTAPNEIVTIHYDRLENLIAMGIVPPTEAIARAPSANPFPNSGRFVADPPPR